MSDSVSQEPDASQVESEAERSESEDRPIAAYPAILGVYAAMVAACLLATKKQGDTLPEHIEWGDILLLGVTTHKVSRVLTKDLITSPLRAPFTEHEELTGFGEVRERPVGQGLQRAVGQLLTCPGCMGQWVATAYAFGLVFNPRVTRLLGSIFTGVTVADFLHMAFVAGKEETT
ncbi:MAG: DUF1360 domain-containing protein [Armatimonadota bacterium]|nr:DUF1360 domain-containing protein [Armatimonadota bacterium]